MILGDLLVDPWKSIWRYIKLMHGFQLECINLINIQIKNIFPRWALMMVRREHRRVGGDTQVSLINFFPSFFCLFGLFWGDTLVSIVNLWPCHSKAVDVNIFFFLFLDRFKKILEWLLSIFDPLTLQFLIFCLVFACLDYLEEILNLWPSEGVDYHFFHFPTASELLVSPFWI